MASGSTTRLNVPYPVSSDSAVIASDIQAVATFIDANVPSYVQAASQPATTVNGNGELWWCTNAASANYGLNYWDGTQWNNITTDNFVVSSTAPSTTFSGLIWYSTATTNGELKYWNGTAWADILPSTTTNGQVLTSSSTGLKWVTPASISSVPSTSGVTSGYVLTNVSGSPTWAVTTVPTNALITAPVETMTINSSGATGTIALPVGTSAGLYYTGNSTGNFTINVTGPGTIMSTGQSMTVTLLVTNGSTAYYPTAFQVDGTSVTPKWQGGVGAPTGGDTNAVDIYTLTIIKTGTSTYTVLASSSKFV